VCHGQLAAERPGVAHLTEFYLWLAVGGVLGGLFNALVAPLIFPAVVEYPLILVLACILRPGFEYPPERRAQQVKVQKRRNEARQLVGARAPDRVGKAIGPQRTDGSGETADIQNAPTEERSTLYRMLSRPLVLDFVLPLLLGLVAVGLVLAVQAYSPGHGSWRGGATFLAPPPPWFPLPCTPLPFLLPRARPVLCGTCLY